MFRIYKAYKVAVHGVAFIPLLITLILTSLGFVLALNSGADSLNSYATLGGYLQVHTQETARSILSGLLAGIISITVFSFSMMMVVVNQAASVYSPKVVETLSERRSNQYILGVYLGSVVFTLITMMHVDNQASGGIPHLALLTNILLAAYCILLFLRFINNISQSVRITNIVENVFRKTEASIASSANLNCKSYAAETDSWYPHNANHAGYFQVVRVKPLLNILVKHDCILSVVPQAGTYYTKSSALFRLNKKLNERNVNEIRETFITYSGEIIAENPMYGFRQLREVAVKSLSPGINDPGVAVLCIDHLSQLLSIWMGTASKNTVFDNHGQPRIILNTFTFAEMLELSISPIKIYGRKDYNVMIALLTAIDNISSFDKSEQWIKLLNTHATSIVEATDKTVMTGMERQKIADAVKKLSGSRYFNLAITED